MTLEKGISIYRSAKEGKDTMRNINKADGKEEARFALDFFPLNELEAR